MSAGWVAGSVRARALAHRRLGPEASRRLASAASLADALRALAVTPYGGRIRPERGLAAAQYEVASTLLWDLRVLAGWLPRDGVRLLRTLGAWFEVANVDELLQAMKGGRADREFQLGALATAWPRLRQATTPAGLRAELADTAWRDPGGESVHAVRLGMRARWAAQVAALGEPASSWAAGAAAVLVAGERFAAGRAVAPSVMRGALRLLGPDASGAATFGGFASAVPASARWALAGVGSPGDLWRAEAAWRHRVEEDGLRLLRTSGTDSGAVLGAVAAIAADTWRVRAALEIAARGGGPLEAYDELA
ncbi:MAG TPA: hypothetical protein VH589_01915 [Trebonia sp.]|jgi:hypothetical protein